MGLCSGEHPALPWCCVVSPGWHGAPGPPAPEAPKSRWVAAGQCSPPEPSPGHSPARRLRSLFVGLPSHPPQLSLPRAYRTDASCCEVLGRQAKEHACLGCPAQEAWGWSRVACWQCLGRAGAGVLSGGWGAGHRLDLLLPPVAADEKQLRIRGASPTSPLLSPLEVSDGGVPSHDVGGLCVLPPPPDLSCAGCRNSWREGAQVSEALAGGSGPGLQGCGRLPQG